MPLKVGFLGLGTMGAPMARNLAKAGFELALATRTTGKAATLAAEIGARACDSPEELARICDVVVSCLPDSPEVEAVHLGERGTIRASPSAAATSLQVQRTMSAPAPASE